MSEQPSMTRRVMRINSLAPDGRPNSGTITLVLRDPLTGEEYRDEDGTPLVYIDLRAIPPSEREAIRKQYTEVKKGANGRPYEETDAEAVQDEILRRAILRWDGIVAANDEPLVCNELTKVALPDYVQLQITRKLFGVETAEVRQASFREPADVLGVVGG